MLLLLLSLQPSKSEVSKIISKGKLGYSNSVVVFKWTLNIVQWLQQGGRANRLSVSILPTDEGFTLCVVLLVK